MQSNAQVSQVARSRAPSDLGVSPAFEQHANDYLRHTANGTYPLSPNMMGVVTGEQKDLDTKDAEHPALLSAPCQR